MGGIIAAAVQGVVSALLSPLRGWLRDRSLKQQGASEQRASDIAQENEVKDAELRAASGGPKSRDDVAGELQRGDF